MELLDQIREMGYELNKDFEFAYHPETYAEPYASFRVIKKFVEFRFFTEELAMLFVLKFGQDYIEEIDNQEDED